MSKKKLALVFILMLLGVGGVFLWQKNQKEVAELNKGLPEGMRVVKNLQGEYWVVNKLDGYEFRAPETWSGIRSINYFRDFPIQNTTGFILESPYGDLIRLVQYGLGESNFEIEDWVKELNDKFEGIYQKYGKEHLQGYEVIKAEEEEFGIAISYFFREKSNIYEIKAFRIYEDWIQEIISSGKW